VVGWVGPPTRMVTHVMFF